MGRPLFKSDCDDLEHFSRKRNAICSQRLLDALNSNHGIPSNDNQQVVEPVQEPEPLPSADPLVEVSLNKIDLIKRAVCKHFGVSKAAIESHCRKKNIVRPRQVAIYLCKTLTDRSYPEIARRFGGRDHTTAMSSVRRIEKTCASDDAFRARVEKVAASLEMSVD